ncbi:hypothetical protein [Lysinibacillus fusiformis]|uniref:glycine-rich domain-containing protein n=1 Tax=Lysinibacillus fusiformis TaxID=28031 RepID=UPI0030189862
MSTDTANYGFKKDNEDEFYNVNVVNANLDKIDTEMKRIEDTIPPISPTDSVKWLETVGGTANALTANDPDIESYKNGLAVSFPVNANSTAAMTLNINGLGAIPIKKANGTAFSNAKANGVYTVRYRVGSFILQGEGGEYGTAVAADVVIGKTIGTENGIVSGALDIKPVHGRQEYITPGIYNFTVPAKVTSLQYLVIGAGGGGGGGGYYESLNKGGGAGGGGGGAWNIGTLAVSPGQVLSVAIGTGGKGGTGGINSTGSDGSGTRGYDGTQSTLATLLASGGKGGDYGGFDISGWGGAGGITGGGYGGPGGQGGRGSNGYGGLGGGIPSYGQGGEGGGSISDGKKGRDGAVILLW